jgi:hypothetical protein
VAYFSMTGQDKTTLITDQIKEEIAAEEEEEMRKSEKLLIAGDEEEILTQIKREDAL